MGNPGVYASRDGITVYDAAGISRVTAGNIGGGNYGIQVISSDGTTVIIDGAANMFKIAATGTMSAAFGVGGGTTVTLTGLGSAFTTPPAYTATTTDNTAVATTPRMGTYFGRGTLATGVVSYQVNVWVALTGGQVQVGLDTWQNTANPGTTGGCRYYVLIEAGI